MPRKKSSEAPTEVVIEGEYPDIEILPTGLHSFDVATGGGLPARTGIEVYGYNYSGKSSLVYYLAGRVASSYEGSIEIADFEGLSKKYLSSAISRGSIGGKIKTRLVAISTKEKGKVLPSTAEEILTRLKDSFSEEGSCVAIVDSVSAIIPASEMDEEIGSGQMGRRAKVMADFCRRASAWLRNKDRLCNVFMVNHLFALMGSTGSSTSGGEAIKNLSQVRVRLTPKEREEDGVMIVKGTIEKHRYRPDLSEGKEFYFVIVPGYGVHPGLSAVIDCINAGLAQRDRTITLGKKSFGFWSKIKANLNEPDFFLPFNEALG